MKYVKNNDDERGSNVFLYFCAVIVHITSIIVGLAFCWSTPVTPKLKVIDGNPLDYSLSDDQLSWLASLTSLGAVVGPFAGGYLGDSIGRKRSFLFTAVLAVLSFAILAFGNNLYLYYIARFTGGICVGTFLAVIPMYIGEIAEIHNRGTLTGLCAVFVTTGQLYCFTIGPYISIQIFSLSCMIFPILFVIACITCLPESPCYLIMKGKQDDAKKSLKKFRRNGEVDDELAELTATVKESFANRGGIMDILKTSYLRRAFSVCAGLMVIQQATAISPILFYLQEIFENAGSSLSKEVASIIIGIVQVISTFSSSLIVDRLGRRPLLLISTAATCISLLILSLYFYLMPIINVAAVSWLPLVTLIVYIFFFNIGIGPLPLTVLGESFPPHVKSAAASFTVATCFLFSFVVAKMFPILASLIDDWFAFMVFGVANGFSVVFIWYKLPETKGKSLAAVLDCFR